MTRLEADVCYKYRLQVTVLPKQAERFGLSLDKRYFITEIIKAWEKKYPSYRFVRCRPFYNEYNGHWYITVIMYKKTDNKSYYDKSRKRALEKRKRINEGKGGKV